MATTANGNGNLVDEFEEAFQVSKQHCPRLIFHVV